MNQLLPLVAITWLLAALWLVLTARVLQQLAQHDLESYIALGRPVMRWLWWSWPTPRPGLPPFLSLGGLAQGQLQLKTLYPIDEIPSLLRLLRWILLSRPPLSVSPTVRRLQRQLRGCALAFVLALAATVVRAAVG